MEKIYISIRNAGVETIGEVVSVTVVEKYDWRGQLESSKIEYVDVKPLNDPSKIIPIHFDTLPENVKKKILKGIDDGLIKKEYIMMKQNPVTLEYTEIYYGDDYLELLEKMREDC